MSQSSPEDVPVSLIAASGPDAVPAGRWAAELYELGHLFGRRGHPVPVLLALQAALAGYALLVAALCALAVPGFHDSGALPLPSHLPFTLLPFDSVSVTGLYLCGVAATAVGWALWIGIGTYLRLLAVHVFHRLALHLCVLLPSALGVILGGLMFAGSYSYELASSIAGRWFMGRSRISRIRKVPRLAAFARLARRRAERRTEARIERSMDVVIPRVRSLVARWSLGGRISVAPLTASSWTQAAMAMRLPHQSFASSGSHLRDDLATIGPEAEALDLVMLPGTWRPRSPTSARRLRWATGSDLLLWGGFLEGENVGWLQIERKVPGLAAEHGDRLRQVRVHTLDGGELFPDHWSPRLTPSLRLDLSDERDIHTAYLLCALQLFEDRSRRRRRLLPRHADRFFALFTVQREALARLLMDKFEVLPEEPLVAYQPPSPDNLLTRAISDWVGHQLSSRGRCKDLRELSQITRLIEKCIVLQPDEPAHYFRYGAILCLHGDGQGALAAFEEAGQQVLASAPRTASADLVEVELALKNGTVPFEERDLHLARCAAFTARALHLGGSDAGRSVREALAGQLQFEDLEEFQSSAGFAVTQHLVRQS